MDPITAINLEFVREVREEWSREAADRPRERSTPAPHVGAGDRLRTLIGAGLVLSACG